MYYYTWNDKIAHNKKSVNTAKILVSSFFHVYLFFFLQ